MYVKKIVTSLAKLASQVFLLKCYFFVLVKFYIISFKVLLKKAKAYCV